MQMLNTRSHDKHVYWIGFWWSIARSHDGEVSWGGCGEDEGMVATCLLGVWWWNCNRTHNHTSVCLFWTSLDGTLNWKKNNDLWEAFAPLVSMYIMHAHVHTWTHAHCYTISKQRPSYLEPNHSSRGWSSIVLIGIQGLSTHPNLIEHHNTRWWHPMKLQLKDKCQLIPSNIPTCGVICQIDWRHGIQG